MEKSEKIENELGKIPKNHGRCVIVKYLRSTCFFWKTISIRTFFDACTETGDGGGKKGKCC